MKSNLKNSPILLIEDNPIDVDLTLRAFKKQNLTNNIVVVRDGEQAINQIELWENGDYLPVVILLDLKLPKVDGLQVLKAIKKHPTYKVIPVVILTSSNDDGDIDSAYKLGANSYIVKPVNFDKFMEVAAHIELYWKVINKPKLD